MVSPTGHGRKEVPSMANKALGKTGQQVESMAFKILGNQGKTAGRGEGRTVIGTGCTERWSHHLWRFSR